MIYFKNNIIKRLYPSIFIKERQWWITASVAVLLILCYSCSDITNNPDKFTKEFIKKNLLTKEDSLQFISKDTVDFGTQKKNKAKSWTLILSNNSESISIIIYSLSAEGLKVVVPDIPNPLPVTILPGQTNVDYPIFLFLDTNGLLVGTYYGKIYINESKIFFLPIKITIIE
jgi:hypothetical protein